MVDITVAKPFYSVLVLAFFCSLMVAGAAVGLRPLQEQNRELDRKKNILLAAGLYEKDTPVAEQFSNIETRIVELDSGTFVSEDTISPKDYDQLKAAMSQELGENLTDDEDIAGLGRVEKYSYVYLVKDESGNIKQIILPIRGKGLWSTMYGYIAIEKDLSTIRGISFYQHGETPGLGGEIENTSWQAGWEEKKIYDDSFQETLSVGGKQAQKDAVHYVDGLSGATLTTNGVDDLITFWFGQNGFKPFLTRLQENGGMING